MNAPELPPLSEGWALFLDVDGCLIDIAEHPDAVRLEPGVRPTLSRLRERLGGAVALVSGRPLSDLDRLFAPPHLAAAGQHGLERRDAAGRILPASVLPEGLDEVESRLALFAERHPGVYLERKSRGLAIHFRQAPQCAEAAERLAQALAPLTRPALVAVPGKMVVELRAPGADKGTAIEAFLGEPPFRGRLPVFVGDDVTDEDGFATVNRLGGHSILVAGAERASQARWRVADAARLRAWLEQISLAEPARQGVADAHPTVA